MSNMMLFSYSLNHVHVYFFFFPIRVHFCRYKTRVYNFRINNMLCISWYCALVVWYAGGKACYHNVGHTVVISRSWEKQARFIMSRSGDCQSRVMGEAGLWLMNISPLRKAMGLD